MAYRLIRWKARARQKGMTLIEVLIGMALSGLIFVALFTLLGKSADFAGFFHGSAASVDTVSESVGLLNTIMPNITRLRSCTCRGSVVNASRHLSVNMSHCYWHPSQPLYDPFYDAGMADDAADPGGILLFAGEFEWFNGGTNTMNTTQLLRSNIVASGPACINYTSLPAAQTRGCKRDIWLIYRHPTLESGSTPSNAGALGIYIADGTSWPLINIGSSTSLGAQGIGITEVSCGFEHASSAFSVGSDRVSNNFVLNFKIKARTNSINQVSHRLYSSWHRSGKNYSLGTFRDVRLKYSFRNLSNRGAYFWRPTSVRNCKAVGRSAASKEECCSLAIAGGACVSCVPSGSAGTVNSCCSEKISGGVCQ
jgi:prepilin-type N-terminal cleavage/methylation domain-containing protein